MIMIRKANGSDAEWLGSQLREFSRFFGTVRALYPSDPAVALAIVHHMIATLEFFVAIDNRTGEPLGFIAGMLGPHPMNPDIRTLSEVFWWVTPARRGSTAGHRLLEHFIEFGHKRADWIVMTLEAKSPVDPSALERRGFRLHERSYLMEVQ